MFKSNPKRYQCVTDRGELHVRARSAWSLLRAMLYNVFEERSGTTLTAYSDN